MNVPPQISLEQWRALLAVVDTGGYANAAETLHKSQSSVTYAIKKLESLLGVEAFELRGRKAHLTPTGELLVRRARVLVDEAGAIERAARRLSAGWEAEITFGVEMIFPIRLVLDALGALGEESPQTRVEVVESVLAGTLEGLVEGRVDLAVAHEVPRGLVGELLTRLRFVLVASPDHPLPALGRMITIDDLRTHRQILVRESGVARATRPWLDASSRWTVGQMATSIEAVRRGHGYAWFPDEKIRFDLDAGTLVPLALEGGSERHVDLHLAFADRAAAGPATLRLAELLREAVAAGCPAAARLPPPVR